MKMIIAAVKMSPGLNCQCDHFPIFTFPNFQIKLTFFGQALAV